MRKYKFGISSIGLAVLSALVCNATNVANPVHAEAATKATAFTCHVDAILLANLVTSTENGSVLNTVFDTCSVGEQSFNSFLDVDLKPGTYTLKEYFVGPNGKNVGSSTDTFSVSPGGKGEDETTNWNFNISTSGTYVLKAYINNHYIGYTNLYVHS